MHAPAFYQAACIAVLAAVASSLLTRWALVYAQRRQLIDIPEARRSHNRPTARGGGIAMVLVIVIGLALASVLLAPVRLLLALLSVATALVAWIGWVDDHRPLSARLRLYVHALAAAIATVGLWSSGLSVWLLVPAWFGLLSFINIWNFMDGINGIATTQALTMALAMAVLALPLALPAASVLSVLLLGACAGFLPFNFPRARIFMGDVGSGALGFVVAAGVLLIVPVQPVPGLCLLAGLAAFSVDSSLTLLVRMWRKERWWQPHVQHVYQRWAAAVGHAKVTCGYWAWSSVGVALVAVCLIFIPSFAVHFLLSWYVVTVAVWLYLRKRYQVKDKSADAES